MNTSKFLVSLLLSVVTCSANAVVVVIEGDGADGSPTYTEDGFTMAGLGGNGIDGIGRGNTRPAIRIGGARPARPIGFSLTQDNGSPFDLFSFQAEGANRSTDAVTVTGVFDDGSPSIVQTFLVPTVPSAFGPLGLVEVTDYTGLISATFESASGGVRVYDNITLDGEVMGTVPEPTTLMLFGLGLAGLGFVRRRMHWTQDYNRKCNGRLTDSAAIFVL